MTTLGTRIRRARERKRWTQQQLADALAVSLRTVGDWERDKAAPRSSIGALEAVLGVSLEEVEAKPKIPPDIEAAIRRSDLAQAVKDDIRRAVEQALTDRRDDDDPDVTLHGPLGSRPPSPSRQAAAASLIPGPTSPLPQPRTPAPAGQPGSPA